MTSVIFDPDARSEFLASIQYYEDCQPGLGLRFRLLIESSIQKIVARPFTYRILKGPFRRYLLPRFPFSLIYTIEQDHIRIIAVAHNRRRPGYWVDRMTDRDEDSVESS